MSKAVYCPDVPFLCTCKDGKCKELARIKAGKSNRNKSVSDVMREKYE